MLRKRYENLVKLELQLPFIGFLTVKHSIVDNLSKVNISS